MTVNVLTEDGTTVNVIQTATPNVVQIIAAGPQGPQGSQGVAGPTASTASFVTTKTFNK